MWFRLRPDPALTSMLVVFLLLIAAFLGSSRCWAQEPESQQSSPSASPNAQSVQFGDEVVTVRADRQARTEKHDYVAQGNVEVSYRDMLLKADQICGNDQTSDVEGEGNVYFEQGLTRLRASRFKFNLDSQTGTFYEVSGKTDFELRGQVDTGFIFKGQRSP